MTAPTTTARVEHEALDSRRWLALVVLLVGAFLLVRI